MLKEQQHFILFPDDVCSQHLALQMGSRLSLVMLQKIGLLQSHPLFCRKFTLLSNAKT